MPHKSICGFLVSIYYAFSTEAFESHKHAVLTAMLYASSWLVLFLMGVELA